MAKEKIASRNGKRHLEIFAFFQLSNVPLQVIKYT